MLTLNQQGHHFPLAEWLLSACCGPAAWVPSGGEATGMPSPPLAHQPPLLALPIAALLRLALVVQLLAARERQLKLGPALVVEVDPQRDQRHALFVDRADELARLTLMQEELARPARLVVEAVGLQVFG